MTSTSPRVGRRAVVLGAATVCAVLALSSATPGATASPTVRASAATAAAPRTTSGKTVQPVNKYNRTNPLAGRTWGVAKDSADQVYPHYQNARGLTKQRLARIALTPRVRWFGAWQKASSLNSLVGKYIAAAKADGGSKTVVQAAVFRLVPNEAQSCGRVATSAEVSAYQSWITAFARAINAHIGDARMMIDLEPDLPHWECSPRGAKHRSMTAYSARVLEAAKNTSVYIDAGASDWRSVSQAVSLLKGSGIRYTRGFILNNTHYTSTTDNINHGYALTKALARAGFGTKHFVLNTSNNAWGFTHAWYYSKKRSAPYDNAPTCSTAAQRGCVTLGIPATTNVAKSTWGLSKVVALRAAMRVDGYVWSGRSWLTMQSHPFNLARALNMAKTGRYMGSYPTR
ncbi:glycoside hydrolase family 6 protein [Jatrophihabitans fulvus]